MSNVDYLYSCLKTHLEVLNLLVIDLGDLVRKINYLQRTSNSHFQFTITLPGYKQDGEKQGVYSVVANVDWQMKFKKDKIERKVSGNNLSTLLSSIESEAKKHGIRLKPNVYRHNIIFEPEDAIFSQNFRNELNECYDYLMALGLQDEAREFRFRETKKNAKYLGKMSGLRVASLTFEGMYKDISESVQMWEQLMFSELISYLIVENQTLPGIEIVRSRNLNGRTDLDYNKRYMLESNHFKYDTFSVLPITNDYKGESVVVAYFTDSDYYLNREPSIPFGLWLIMAEKFEEAINFPIKEVI